MEMTTPVETHMSPGLQEALVKFHQKAIIIKEEGKANYGKYATYEQIIQKIRPLMSKEGLFFHHISHPAQGGAAVETVIYGHGGQISSGIVRIPASKQDEHKYGGAITYAKRYSLNLALGLGGDPDPIEEAAEEDLPTVVEAKQKAKTKKVEEKSEVSIKNELFQEAQVAAATTREEAIARYKKFENGMRSRGLTVDKQAFNKWLEEKFDA